MKELVFSGTCRGIGVSHIIRDCDFTETTGYYRNEYQIHYICEGERFFFISQRGYKMVRGAIAFIDKRQIPTTNVVGVSFITACSLSWKKAGFCRWERLLDLIFSGSFRIIMGFFF